MQEQEWKERAHDLEIRLQIPRKVMNPIVDFIAQELAAQRESFKNTTAMASESIEAWKQEGREELRAELREKVKGMKKIRKPTHGTCCTCQTCGHSNDYDCECPRNSVLEEIVVLLTPTEEPL